MNNYEFLFYYFRDMPYYFGALLIVFTIYILLFKRFYYSVLDPMVISFVGSALACTIVVFLYIDKVINLDISNSKISDLTGIEYFKNLKELDASNNNINDVKFISLSRQQITKCLEMRDQFEV